MARLEFRLPDIGEGVTEGEIVEWFVRPGDAVVEDDPMVEVMTDKATVTIGAPCDGRVEALRFEVGGVANVGQVILVLEPSAESNVGQAQRSSRPPATAVGEISDELPGAKLFEHASGLETGNRIQTEKPLATPAVRRLAKQLGVDLRRVRGSGEEGRVTESDGHAAAPVHGSNESLEERKPILGVRRKIAERMHRATTTAAHFTFVEECDASRLVDMRGRLAPEAERQGVKLTFVPFILKAKMQLSVASGRNRNARVSLFLFRLLGREERHVVLEQSSSGESNACSQHGQMGVLFGPGETSASLRQLVWRGSQGVVQRV